MTCRLVIGACLLASACATVPAERDGQRTWMPHGRGPQRFAPAIPSVPDEAISEPAFTPDGRSLVFQQLVDGRYTIRESRFERGAWTAPRTASFSGAFDDAMPCFAPGGRQLFFISKRPREGDTGPARSDYDIWVVDREGAGWAAARSVGPSVNTAQYEVGDSSARSGNLYFAAFRPRSVGSIDIWVSRPTGRVYGPPEGVGPAINTTGQESHPAIDPDERFLVFERYHGPQSGRFTLWVSYRREGRWLPAQQLGPEVNARLVTSHPKLSPDGKVLFWNSKDDPAATTSVLMHAWLSDVLPAAPAESRR